MTRSSHASAIAAADCTTIAHDRFGQVQHHFIVDTRNVLNPMQDERSHHTCQQRRGSHGAAVLSFCQTTSTQMNTIPFRKLSPSELASRGVESGPA